MYLCLADYFDPKTLINTHGWLAVQEFQLYPFQFLELEFIVINNSLNWKTIGTKRKPTSTEFIST